MLTVLQLIAGQFKAKSKSIYQYLQFALHSLPQKNLYKISHATF